LTFELVIQTRPSEAPNTCLCEFGANPFSGSDISYTNKKKTNTRMWANAQGDGRPAKYKWRPLFNDAKFG